MRKTRKTIRRMPGPVSRDLARLVNEVAGVNARLGNLLPKVIRMEAESQTLERAIVEAERLRAALQNGG